MTSTCITCGSNLRQIMAKWVVFGTGTETDGTATCPPGPNPEGKHVPRCWNDFCVSNHHDGDAHVSNTGYSWREGRVLDRSPVFEVTQIHRFDSDGLWVTAWDADGMEVELTLSGFSPDRLHEWSSSNPSD